MGSQGGWTPTRNDGRDGRGREGRGGKYVSKDAKIPYTLSVQCEDEGDGTKVTWHQEMESLKGFFKLADPIVLKLYARDVRSNLARAKSIVES